METVSLTSSRWDDTVSVIRDAPPETIVLVDTADKKERAEMAAHDLGKLVTIIVKIT